MGAVGTGVPGWVDLGSPDMDATKRFYGELFGWEAQVSPDPQFGGYTIFTKDGQSVAGAGPLMSPDQPVAWTTYVIVANADETAAKVEHAGGQVIAPPFDIPTQGRMAIFLDSTGSAFGIWQPGEMKGAELFNAPGALSWDELATRDVPDAKAFYSTVFGWATQDNVDDAGEITYTQWLVSGRPIGGMMAMGDRFPADVPPHWAVYFGVADCDESAALIAKLGGTVHGPVIDIPEGRFAAATDPHGAPFNIFQPAPTPGD
jgi:predicted enzyme related to lactoylglutathione lyase